MKITLLLPSMFGAGAHRMYLRLASQFAAMGHEVDLVLMDGENRQFENELSSAVRVVDLRQPRLWTSLPAFWSYLRNHRPDVVLASMPLANGIAAWACRFLLNRPRLIISERNALLLVMGEIETPSTARPSYQVLMRIIRYSYRFADALVAVSEGVAERVRRIPGVPSERVHVLYNPAYPVQLETSLREQPNHPWLKLREIPVVLGVGRLVPQKDFATLIRAVALVNVKRDVRLIILGDGEDRAELERLASHLGISTRVSFPGFVENPLPFMKHASLFVLSSAQEGFGNVIVEAMACGTPVVSTESTGPSEILEAGRYGPLVPVGNAEALAAAIEAQLDDPVPSDALQARAREFSVEASADAYLKLARQLGAGR